VRAKDSQHGAVTKRNLTQLFGVNAKRYPLFRPTFLNQCSDVADFCDTLSDAQGKRLQVESELASCKRTDDARYEICEAVHDDVVSDKLASTTDHLEEMTSTSTTDKDQTSENTSAHHTQPVTSESEDGGAVPSASRHAKGISLVLQVNAKRFLQRRCAVCCERWLLWCCVSFLSCCVFLCALVAVVQIALSHRNLLHYCFNSEVKCSKPVKCD